MTKIVLLALCVLTYVVQAQDVNQTAYQRYINVEQIGKMVPGYYVQGSKKIPAEIKFLTPIDMQDAAVPFTINKGAGDEVMPKSKTDAVAFGDQVFVPEDLGDSVVWLLLSREGAIRETVYFKPVPANTPKYYEVNHMITNTLTHEGHFVGSLAVNFNKIMASLTSENPEIAQKIEMREEGYRFINYQKIIAEFNLWFQNANPKKIKYIGDIPDFQGLIDNDVSKYLPKN